MIIKHKLIFYTTTLLLALSLIAGCTNGDKNATADIINQGAIIVENNAALRINPVLFSGCISRLEKGCAVEVLDKSAQKSNIARTKDYWYYVKLEDGITGWVYGQNLKFVDVKNRKQMEDAIAEFRSQDSGNLLKGIAGKWWSTNSFGDFTNHGLELNEDQTYKSYLKGGEKYAVEGEFTIDYAKNEISFPKGTSFKRNMRFIQQGISYTLFAENEDNVMRFKKIQDVSEVTEQEQPPPEYKPEPEQSAIDSTVSQPAEPSNTDDANQ